MGATRLGTRIELIASSQAAIQQAVQELCQTDLLPGRLCNFYEAQAGWITTGQSSKDAPVAETPIKRSYPAHSTAGALDNAERRSPNENSQAWACEIATAATACAGVRAESSSELAMPFAPLAAPAQSLSETQVMAPISTATTPTTEVFPGLSSWLARFGFSKYAEAAASWVEEHRVSDLDEVLCNLEDFADVLGLKKLERLRLNKYSATEVGMAQT